MLKRIGYLVYIVIKWAALTYEARLLGGRAVQGGFNALCQHSFRALIKPAGSGLNGGSGLNAGSARLLRLNPKPAAASRAGFSSEAIVWSMPAQLKAAAEAAGPGGVPADLCRRIWTTLLCVAALKAMNECYLLRARSAKEAGSFDETVVDRAMAFLQEACGEHEELGLMTDKLEAEAEAFVTAWKRRQALNTQQSRVAWKEQMFARNALDAQRIGGAIIMAMRRGHATFFAFFAPSALVVVRWQQALLLFTSIMGMLTIDIW